MNDKIITRGSLQIIYALYIPRGDKHRGEVQRKSEVEKEVCLKAKQVYNKMIRHTMLIRANIFVS